MCPHASSMPRGFTSFSRRASTACMRSILFGTTLCSRVATAVCRPRGSGDRLGRWLGPLVRRLGGILPVGSLSAPGRLVLRHVRGGGIRLAATRPRPGRAGRGGAVALPDGALGPVVSWPSDRARRSWASRAGVGLGVSPRGPPAGAPKAESLPVWCSFSPIAPRRAGGTALPRVVTSVGRENATAGCVPMWWGPDDSVVHGLCEQPAALEGGRRDGSADG